MMATSLPAATPPRWPPGFARLTGSALVDAVAATLMRPSASARRSCRGRPAGRARCTGGSPSPATVAVVAALTAAFGAIGLRVLRMTDAEWDGIRTPVRAGAPVPA